MLVTLARPCGLSRGRDGVASIAGSTKGAESDRGRRYVVRQERGDWGAALAASDTTRYVNRLGIEARAYRLKNLSSDLTRVGLELRHWYGVVTFTEFAAMEAPVPAETEFAEIVACEERAGQTDPYRSVAALLHLIACRNDLLHS